MIHRRHIATGCLSCIVPCKPQVQLDSITSNELGDPGALVKVQGRPDITTLSDWQSQPNLGASPPLPRRLHACTSPEDTGRRRFASAYLRGSFPLSCVCSDNGHLWEADTCGFRVAALLSLSYDAMPAEYASVIITEFGARLACCRLCIVQLCQEGLAFGHWSTLKQDTRSSVLPAGAIPPTSVPVILREYQAEPV